MSYEVFIEKKHTKGMLRKEVAKFLNIGTDFIEYLFDEGPGGEVTVDVMYLKGDFLTRLSVYKRNDFAANLEEIDFAMYLAQKLKENVLLTYWGNNPFLWILVEPNGGIYKVHETPPEREKVMQIDKSFKEKLTMEQIKAEFKS